MSSFKNIQWIHQTRLMSEYRNLRVTAVNPRFCLQEATSKLQLSPSLELHPNTYSNHQIHSLNDKLIVGPFSFRTC